MNKKENLIDLVLKDFSSDGILAKVIPNFTYRQQQIDLATLISQSISEKSILLAEAGTGTGKTFAYLLPALRTDKKILISTGSKALQDQLFNKDLPMLLKAMTKETNMNICTDIDHLNGVRNKNNKVALLKGRSNYLCLEKLDQQMRNPHHNNQVIQSQMIQIKFWSLKSTNGDISQCSIVPEENPIWSNLTSTNDSCIGNDCPRYNECFVNQARKEASEAQIVIVNHHLFFADIALKEVGFGKIIPEMDIFILDEAHQIPDIANQYFGEQLTSRQLYDISKDIQLAYRIELRDTHQLQKCADYLTQTVKQLRLVLGDNSKGYFSLINHHSEIIPLLNKLNDALTFSIEVVLASLGRSEILDNCYQRLITARNVFNKLIQTPVPGHSYWFEVNRSHFLFACTPLSIAPIMKKLIEKKQNCWIFTSATLSTNGSFEYFNQRMGLTNVKKAIFDSPFDYLNQALLCVPRYLPALNDPNYTKQLVIKLKPIIELNQGRCFFLCTSHTMLNLIAIEFRKYVNTFPIFVQGEMSKTQLLNCFIESGNALLIGTNSFWEGIDIKGQALSCVIIDKLPFQSPDNPLLKARIEDATLRGKIAFDEIQLPEAIIALKQGVGRLIRDDNDKGVIILCDNRLVMKNYGAKFIKSLPPMKRTRDLQEVSRFLKNLIPH